MWAARMLAVSAVVCLSLSCDKDTPVVVPEEPSYVPPLEEKILLAASATQFISGYTEKNKKVTFLFSEPFHFGSLPEDIEQVTLDWKDLLSLVDGQDGVRLTFTDRKTALLRYQNEVALELDGCPEGILLDYPCAIREIPFSVTKVGRGTLSVSTATEGPLAATCEWNPEEKSGTLVLTFPPVQDASGRVTLSLTDGTHSASVSLETKTYRFRVEAEPVVLRSTGGSKAPLAYRLETDIPDCELSFTPEADAFFSLEDGYLIALEDNPLHEMRTSRLVIAESGGKMDPFFVEVRQKATPVSPGERPVVFRDGAFEKAMVAAADRNGDGEVSFNEALEVREIGISGKGVSDLTGLEAFRNVWKVDARDNAIGDATVLGELPLLRWLDLKGNRSLRVFDVTGCTLYFEHCEFEVTEDLVYYTLRNQTGVTNGSDPGCAHSRHVEDTRETADWTSQDEIVLMQSHVKGRGYPVVFTGVSYLDADMKDGSFERLMRRAMQLMLENYPCMDEYGDYLDFYCMKHKAPDRNAYYLPEEDYGFDNPRCVSTYERFFADEAALLMKAYGHFYGGDYVPQGMWGFLIECTPSGHPGRFQAGFNFAGFSEAYPPEKYGPVFEYSLHTQFGDEPMYGYLSSCTLEELFRNVPKSSSYRTFLETLPSR